jgi:aminoglycoside phosphotransferase (APT) family kinase protein
VHYGNLVFHGDDPVALLDWDFVMPGDALYDVVTLLFSARNPRPELPDEFEDRAVSARHTLAALLDGYGADDAQRRRATSVAAAMCRGAADFLVELGVEGCGAGSVAEFDEELARRRFLADWWPQQSVS